MTDPIEQALRRELRAASVSYDEDGADAMIRAAIATRPRTWVAPVAAAATVVAVGGSVAYFGLHNGSAGAGQDAAGGPACSPATPAWAPIATGSPATDTGLRGSASAVATAAPPPARGPMITVSPLPPSYRVDLAPICATDLPGTASAVASHHGSDVPLGSQSIDVPLHATRTYVLPAPPAGERVGDVTLDSGDRAAYIVFLGQRAVGTGTFTPEPGWQPSEDYVSDGKTPVRVGVTCVTAKDGSCNGSLTLKRA